MTDSTKKSPQTQEDLWPDVLADLRNQTTAATFDTWLASTKIVSIQQSLDSPPLYTIEGANSQAVDWLKHRLKDVIERTLASVAGAPVNVTFVAKKYEVYEPLDVLGDPDEPDADEPDAEFIGAYHDKRNAIIQPDRVEVHSQYFRLKWRPLLGPLLSELIRELRQRCYYGKGKDTSRRNTAKVTQANLAKSLGVSRGTIVRALTRDEAGNFKNEYLEYFIKSMEVLKKEADNGRIIYDKTKFVIYLDDPLTPEDDKKVRDSK